MNVTVIGTDHKAQWADPTGDFQELLQRLVREADVKLIAEEAYKLPTTVGFRVACRANLPWLDFDMDDSERLRAGIYEELNSRPSGPVIKEDGTMAPAESYLPHADGIREAHWVKRLMRHEINSAVVICGVLHLSPLAARLRNAGCTVKERNMCEETWYQNKFGRCKIMEENGRRWFEFPAR